jgi:hypothetical protein
MGEYNLQLMLEGLLNIYHNLGLGTDAVDTEHTHMHCLSTKQLQA